jgi:hypothetical protein
LYGDYTNEEISKLEALGATITSKPTFDPKSTEMG